MPTSGWYYSTRGSAHGCPGLAEKGRRAGAQQARILGMARRAVRRDGRTRRLAFLLGAGGRPRAGAARGAPLAGLGFTGRGAPGRGSATTMIPRFTCSPILCGLHEFRRAPRGAGKPFGSGRSLSDFAPAPAHVWLPHARLGTLLRGKLPDHDLAALRHDWPATNWITPPAARLSFCARPHVLHGAAILLARPIACTRRTL